MFTGTRFSVMPFCSLVGASLSVHYREAVQILWCQSNYLEVGWIDPKASRNCTAPAHVMRIQPSALIVSYLSSKLKPSMSFSITNTLTWADAPESAWTLTDLSRFNWFCLVHILSREQSGTDILYPACLPDSLRPHVRSRHIRSRVCTHVLSVQSLAM